MPSFKPESTPSFSEFETHERQAKPHGSRLVESFRLSLTSLALLAGITIIGTSGDTLGVYNTTHLGEDFFLPLWPSQFDIRPTIALVSCGGIITVASAASLAVSKVNAVCFPPTSFCINANIVPLRSVTKHSFTPRSPSSLQ